MLHYSLDFSNYNTHIIDIQLCFEASPQQQVWLASWIPGSYLIREFSKHIESLNVSDDNAQPIPCKKITKNRWLIDNPTAQKVYINYRVYAYDLSVRGSYVDQQRLYLNPATLCLAVEGQQQTAVELKLNIPDALQHFDIATALETTKTADQYLLTADNYMQLIDSPIELAVQDQFEFEAGNIAHRFVISGIHDANLDRLKQDLQKICQTQINLYHEAPFQHYLFMTIATADLYGGLEHAQSTSLITPRNDLAKQNEPALPSTEYQRFLGLCSHEYFHSWMVKFIRPENYVSPDLNSEGYTRLLWVFEGFTSYYDDLILRRSGIINDQQYLKLLSAQITRYLQNPGREVQSVAESSFDAWIKFYRQDENSINAGTSYYNKGALIALCLDLKLRQHHSSLDHLVYQLFQQAKQGIQVNDQSIQQLAEDLTSIDWQSFFDQYINHTDPLPVAELLTDQGIKLKYKDEQFLAFGAQVKPQDRGLLVQRTRRNSSAAGSGLSAHDVIIALNGIQANEKNWKLLAAQSKAVKCHFFRRDELLETSLTPEKTTLDEVELTIENPDQVATWLYTS